jgi:hypothetical protein
MLPKFRLRTVSGVRQWIIREPVDWPNVGVYATCGAIVGISIVGLWLELAR